MKLPIKKSGASGNVLLAVMLTAGMLVLALETYLNLATTEHNNVKRSLSWNAALPEAEAGIEEALSHLGKNTNDYSLDGWIAGGTNNNKFSKRRVLGSDYYNVSIYGYPNSVVNIDSTGAVLTAKGAWLSRAVRVTARTSSVPPIPGFVANNISFGGDVGVDSYDSTDPLHSNRANNTTGYYDASRATDQALLATPGVVLNLGGNTHVKGYAAVGVGGTVNLGGSATVGSASFGGSVQPGHVTNSFSYYMPEIKAPYASGATPTNGYVNGIYYSYVLTGTNYLAVNLDADGSSTTMYVSNSSIVYVTGNLSVDKIFFNTNNAPRLDLYLASDVIFCPQVINGASTQFYVWGLDSCTSMDMTGRSSFVGTIFARKVRLHGGGSADFYGAFVANSFDCTGNFEFHFDTSGSNRTVPATQILSWAEK
jgi:hypothetical protein